MNVNLHTYLKVYRVFVFRRFRSQLEWQFVRGSNDVECTIGLLRDHKRANEIPQTRHFPVNKYDLAWNAPVFRAATQSSVRWMFRFLPPGGFIKVKLELTTLESM